MALAAISLALLGSQNEQTMLTQILKPFVSRIGIGLARERQQRPRPQPKPGFA
jgi:hypothetical protein